MTRLTSTKTNKNINFVRVNVQTSSWRPPGTFKRIFSILNIFIVICLFIQSSEAQLTGPDPVADNVPNPETSAPARQGRERWARSTTERNFIRQSWTPILAPQDSQEQPQDPSSAYFGRKISRSSTVEEVKPSHIRKRNFGATFIDAVDKENAEKITDFNDLPTTTIIKSAQGNANTKPWIGITANDQTVNSEETSDTKSDRVRERSFIRNVNRENDFKEWERLRLNKKIRPKPEITPNVPSSSGSKNVTEPRRRIKLNGSFLGIYSKTFTTPRSRPEEDLPQRPEVKRERIRNLRIRRPFITGNDDNKVSTTSKTSTSTTSRTKEWTSTTVVSTSSSTSTEKDFPSLSDSEKIINLKGLFKEYKEIVRTTPKTVTENSAKTSNKENLYLEDDVTTISSTSTSSSTVVTEGVQDSTTISDTTTSNIDFEGTLPKLESENISSTMSNREQSSESVSISKSSNSSIQSATTATIPSTTASLTVTESKELLGSRVDHIEQSKTHINEEQAGAGGDAVESASVQPSVDTTTRTPIEIYRPREALQKDLLEAIRRKISRNKAATQTDSSNQAENNEGRNFIAASTKTPLYRPLSFVGSRKNESNSTESKVKIFINLPSKYQDSSSVKIPNISHIRNKIERLNEAITEGLKLDRLREKEEAAIENDWRHRDHHANSQKSVVKSHSSSIEIDSHSSNDAGNQETIRKQLFEAPSRTGADIKNQFESTATTLRAETTTTAQTTSTSSTTVKTTKSSSKKKLAATQQQHEHPSSHYRPSNWSDTDFIPMPKSNLPPKEDVQLFVVPPSSPKPSQSREQHNNRTAAPAQSLDRSSKDSGEGSQDITNTTIIVISVVAVIPIAGLVAWAVRTVLRRKGLSGSESSSETGLNRPITEDDSLQISGRGGLSFGGHCFDSIAEAPENIPKDHAHGAHGGSGAHADMLGSVWEFPRSRLRLQTVLGEGNFGKVWKAEADEICGNDGTILVAVKTVKENSAQKEVDDLIQEMKIMQEIGSHPNVVTILGVCTQQEPYLLVMEYVMYGKLLTHLREHRMKQSSFFNFSKDGGEVGETLTSKDLTKFAYGVAKGMEYLVSKGIIHRDLAARNILVDHTKNTKISDFGLSRSLRDLGSEMYEQKTKGALPIRWMAPESLYFSVFTPKSDVWGFGILMWEIVTLGSTPYPGMGAREVMRKVRDGYRLERPAHCHPDLYAIIQKCWLGDMNKRPDFSELRKELAKLLEDQHGYIDLQNIPEHKYYSMDKNPDEDEKL